MSVRPAEGIRIVAPKVPPKDGEVVVRYEEVAPHPGCCHCDGLSQKGVVAVVLLIIFFFPLAWIPCCKAECFEKRQRPVYGPLTSAGYGDPSKRDPQQPGAQGEGDGKPPTAQVLQHPAGVAPHHTPPGGMYPQVYRGKEDNVPPLAQPGGEEAFTSTRTIREGDLVIVYERFGSMRGVTVDSSSIFNNRAGHFPVRDWVGRPFGSRVQAAKGGRGWLHLLAPTPELWTEALRHRTQILYLADIALVCAFLELRPGLTVLECGTGSGSLTHSLARAVAPTGRVHTFEFHEQRAAEARVEFEEHGLGAVVSLAQRNIEAEGFPPELHGRADALFLDLPGPWKAVDSAAACLRMDGTFCSFSPCIEQVQKTCAALARSGWFALPRVMECLLRSYEVHQDRIQTDLSWQPPKADPRGQKRKRGSHLAEEAPQPTPNGMAGGAGDAAVSDGGEEGPWGEAEGDAEAAPEGKGVGSVPGETEGTTGVRQPWKEELVTRPCPEAKGHTGYLVFARKLPEQQELEGDGQ